MKQKPWLWWDRSINDHFGCAPVSPGCHHCWAAQSFWDDDHNRPKPGREGLVERGPKFGNIRWTGTIQNNPAFDDQVASLAKLPVGAVVAYEFMGDTFHDHPDLVSRRHIVFALAEQHRRLNFVVTTKRAGNIRTMWAEYCDHLGQVAPNIWLLLSVSTQAELASTLAAIDGIKASVIGLSIEPMIEPIDLAPYYALFADGGAMKLAGVKPWVIMGAETCRRSLGEPKFFAGRWAYDVVYGCVAAGVPCFYKYGPGENGFCNGPCIDGKHWYLYPQINRVPVEQQEFLPAAGSGVR